MTSNSYHDEVDRISRQIPGIGRVGVIGSQLFWGESSEEICNAIGAGLARSAGVVLLTGGVFGVGEAVGRSFFLARRGSSHLQDTYHILPLGDEAWDYGVTLFAGDNMHDRREILARLANVYVCVEGGPGTAHEAQLVKETGAKLIPVGSTGGVAENLYREMTCPDEASGEDWAVLGDATCSIERIAEATVRTVLALLRHR